MKRFLLALAVLAALPSATQAQAVERGSSTIEASGPAARELAREGVRIAGRRPVVVATIAQGAVRGSRHITLPVERGAITSEAWIDHGGRIVLQRRKRKLTLREVRVDIGPRTTVSALVGRSRRTLFTGTSQRPSLNAEAGTAALSSTTVWFTLAGERLVRRALKVGRLSARRFGTVAVDALLGSTGPAGPSGPQGPAPSGDPAPAPEPQSAPPSNQTITGATIEWHVRDSFIQYVNSGEGTSVAGGATALAPTVRPGSSESLVYDFAFPSTGGWHDPSTNQAVVSFRQGLVNFKYSSHGISFDTAEPEVELNGASSRLTMRFDDHSQAGTGSRGVLVDLHLDQAESIVHDGSTHTYTKVPGTIPEGTDTGVFAGFYSPGEEFGWVSVTYTTG